jgi:hypothetical protein
MNELSISAAQADMRRAYLCGAPGVLVSGIVWLIAGLVAVFVSEKYSVFALLIGGALIHPSSLVVTKWLGHNGAHTPGNALARLAGEATFWLLAGIAIAYVIQTVHLAWFFPAMLLIIGSRYLTFQTLYGLRIYWILGVTLCAVGFALAALRAPASFVALGGASIEIIFAVLIFRQSKA